MRLTIYPLFLVFLLTTSIDAATEFGTILVKQNTGGNESSSVTLSLAPGASPSARITGGNRGDYNISLGNTDDPFTGVVISCAAQTIRDDSMNGGPALGSHHATTAIQASGSRYYVPVFRAPEGDEANINASFTFFPYSTWIGGVASNSINGGPITSLVGSPELRLNTHFVDSKATEGIYQLNLSSLVTNASQNGILLVCGAKNEDNYALSKANNDGSFTIYCHDNGVNSAVYENDPVAFCYLPTSAIGTNRLVAMGRVNNNATTDIAAGSFTVNKAGTGRWLITIPGYSASTGVLIVSPEGGAGNNVDNIVSSAWDADNGCWIVESRDLPDLPLQNMLTPTDDVFSFAYFSTMSPGTPPTISLTSPTPDTTSASGNSVTLSATATDDKVVSVVRFYDGDTIIAEDFSPPYQFVWDNPPLGFHTINARATDNQGLIARSASSNLAITPPAGNEGIFFDGYNDVVTLGKPTAHQLTKFTLECWFRREPGGVAVNIGDLDAIPLIAKGRADGNGCDFFLGIDAQSGKLAANFKDSTVRDNHPLIGNTEIPFGVWHHASATFDGKIWKLYLNGNVDAEGDTGGQAPSPDADRITSYGSAMNSVGTAGGFFLGMMDEVRIWNRALSQSEIRSGINQSPPATNGLVTWHRMSESGGSVLLDSSGSGVNGTLTNGVFRTQGAPFNLNVPPDLNVIYPQNLQSGLDHNPTLTVQTTDPDDTQLTIRFFGRETSSGALSDFSIVALPDTQWYSENEGGDLAAIFSAQTDWVVAQRNALKIAAVLHLGDITQNGDNPTTATTQWHNASTAMYRLENPITTMLPHGIPYSMAVGNHDQTPIGNADGTTTGFNTYFGVHPITRLNHFRNMSYYGGTSIPDSADNNYITFSAGGLEFIVISFEYDTTPDAEDLAWADDLLKSHPNHCGIITTHWTVNTGNPASFSPQGSAIYEALKSNPNLVLMHGGHIAGEGRRSDTYQGRTVHSLLADYQSRENGGNGWLRIMTFRPSQNRIEVQTYSPTLNRYETDADSKFNLDVDLSGRGKPFVELGAQTLPPGASSFTWSGRAAATRYEWYAEVSDGENTTKTPIQTFTTSGTEYPPNVSFTAPVNGASFPLGTPVTLRVNATDSDGKVEKVSYYTGTTLIGATESSPFTLVWSSPSQGIHTLIAKATDDSGLETTSSPIEIQVNPPPSVTLTTLDGEAGEFGNDQSLSFQIARTGAVTSDLDVFYSISGTATPVIDYTAIPGVLRIPSGHVSAVIPITVIPDDLAEGDENIILNLSLNSNYLLGTPSTAQATIKDRPLGTWLHSRGKLNVTGDQDGNGVPDLIDYYMGNSASKTSYVRAKTANDGTFTATFFRSKIAADVDAEIEWSADLKSWNRSGNSDGERTVTISDRTTSPDNEDPETVEAILTITSGTPTSQIFLRLSVTP